jgi:hypothetical protein
LLTIKTILKMTKQERIDKFNTELDTVTNDIAADYQQLKDEAVAGTVSDESIAQAEANIEKLKALGASVVAPAPTDPGTGDDTTDTGTL